MAANIDLRAFVYLDSMQPQYAAFLGTVAQGFLPLAGDAALYVEISPGIEINRLTDVALKSNRVRPAMQIVERVFGLLEIHSESQAEVRGAGAAILRDIGLQETDRLKPRVLSSQIVRRVDDHQAQLINRQRHGQMLIPGQTPLRARGGAGALRGAGRQRGGEGGGDQRARGARLRQLRARLPGRARSGTSTSAGGRRRRPSRGSRAARRRRS